MGQVFIAGGTGYIGSRLIPMLAGRGHQVRALVRPGSETKLPRGCEAVLGDALDGTSYADHVSGCDTFVQLVGVSHPSPAKAEQFVKIDQKSGLEAIRVASETRVGHFVYMSVAHPAPVMHAYIGARTVCETAIEDRGLNATIIRPWYVLGPGHRWPYLLIPFYWLAERYPPKREAARRLGLVTLPQILTALARAVESRAAGVRIVEVPEIRSAKQ